MSVNLNLSNINSDPNCTAMEEQASHVSSEKKGSVGEVLKNTVVLREVFKFLSVKTLLKCSLVNKTWNFEARCFIRDFRECTVEIGGKLEGSRQKLKRLDSLIARMSCIPFNGLKITLGHFGATSSTNLSLETICRNIIQMLSLKSISITWPNSSGTYDENRFISKQLEQNGSTLEKIALFNVDPEFPRIFGDDHKLWLPRLNILILDNWENGQDIVQRIFYASPNLKKVSGTMCPRVLRAVPGNKYKLLDQFRVCVESISDEQVCLQLAEEGPALRELFVDFPRSIQVRLLPAVFEELLLSSQTTLEKLTLDIGPFITLGQLSSVFPPLRNLRQFTLFSHETTEILLHTLRTTDYSHVLPSLESVHLFVRPYLRREWEPTFERHRGICYSCRTVTTLELETDGETISLADMKNIFPNVTTLKVTWEGTGADLPFEDFWRLWPSLVHLDLTIRRGTEALYENFDPVFCGVSPEEADELRRHKPDYLRKLNLVPVRPSLTTMLCLKSFRIMMEREPYYYPDPGEYPDFLSHVSETLVFGRMPNLAVTITNNEGSDLIGRCMFFIENLLQRCSRRNSASNHNSKLELFVPEWFLALNKE